MPRLLQDLQNDVVSFFRQTSNTSLNLFEIACLGKPELALQGELLHYLRTEGWLCVQEAGYRAPVNGSSRLEARNLDILVFDRTHAHFDAMCCIELKHFSANQGNPTALINGLEDDYKRQRPHHLNALPIMLIGMYTTINASPPFPLAPGLHRFARAVCGPVRSRSFDADLNAWKTKTIDQWLHGPDILSSVTGIPAHHCILQSEERLDGWVEACVGIRP